MTRFTYLLLATMAGINLSSCSHEKHIWEVANKSDYLTTLQQLSDSEREKQVRADAKQLSELADSLKTMSFYFGFSLDLSSGSGRNLDIDAATAFQLQDADTLRADFIDPERRLYLVQQYALPESGFALMFQTKVSAYDPKKPCSLQLFSCII